MEREVVSDTFEEFLERLLRWGELCAQLRELYYKYLDLAAFRSEKCFFPGRKCRRSWDRKYDVDDLTLMWTYILNTAPLCGKLIRALAEVEYKIRLRALESFEKYGGIVKKQKTGSKYKITHIRLKRPVYAYLVLLKDRLYVVWEDPSSTLHNRKGSELVHWIMNVIKKCNAGENVGMPVDIFEVDDSEVKRFWLEVPLPSSASRLFNGKDNVPVALLRNLGWLLSDDWRQKPGHVAGNFGQVAVRLLDWIALAKYAEAILSATEDTPLIFRLKVYRVIETRRGYNSTVSVLPIGTTKELISTVYKDFGITLGKFDTVIAHGYAVLRALREGAIKKEGRVYVVDDVGSWIAFSSIVSTLILGDGAVYPWELRVAVKSVAEATLDGKRSLIEELKTTLGGVKLKRELRLISWHPRLLLPSPPVPTFKKSVKLYEMLTHFPSMALVKVDDKTYLLSHTQGRIFVIGKGKAADLLDAISRLGLPVKIKHDMLVLTYTQLKRLERLGFVVRFLNDMEKDGIREVKTPTTPNMEELEKTLAELLKVARITTGTIKGRTYIKIIFRDKFEREKAASMLRSAGVRVSELRQSKEIRVYERRSVEAILKTLSRLFSQTS